MRSFVKGATLALSLLALAGCGNSGGGGVSELTVKFIDSADLTTEVSTAQTVKYGEKASKPADQVKSGFEFEGWFKDKYCKVEFDFDVAITANWTIFASFSSAGPAPSSSGTSVDPGTSSSVTPTGSYTYTCTDMPTWIKDDGCVIFAWSWSPKDNGSWHALEYEGDTAAKFTVDEELTGFLLARCAAGTTTPDWNNKGNTPGRVYNQTSDITCTSGTYSYKCTTWKEYK